MKRSGIAHVVSMVVAHRNAIAAENVRQLLLRGTVKLGTTLEAGPGRERAGRKHSRAASRHHKTYPATSTPDDSETSHHTRQLDP